jgi:hypothetical protein
MRLQAPPARQRSPLGPQTGPVGLPAPVHAPFGAQVPDGQYFPLPQLIVPTGLHKNWS